MIQRIQSIYLFLAALCMLLMPWFFPLFVLSTDALYLIDDPIFFAGYLLSGLISLFTIFRYKNRQQQVVSGRINIILNFVLFGFLIYYYYQHFDTAADSLGIASFLPIATVVFVSLANRGIMRDEALVRAADRFR